MTSHHERSVGGGDQMSDFINNRKSYFLQRLSRVRGRRPGYQDQRRGFPDGSSLKRKKKFLLSTNVDLLR